MKLNFLFVLFISLSVISCKKDKLEGDAEILTGTWNWINTEQITNTCGPDSLWNYSYLDSSATSKTYSIEFVNKGKVIWYHNEGIITRQRIVFESMVSVASASYSFEFTMNMNNNENDIMHGFVGEDSLLLDDFPLDTDNSCETRLNHFIRR